MTSTTHRTDAPSPVRAPRRAVTRAALGAALLALAAPLADAQEPTWTLIRPSNTGIPGEQLHHLEVGPADDVWVAGRFPFWQEGGISSFDGTTWTARSNHDVPELDQWTFDVDFGPDGTRWYATKSGLVREQDGVYTRWHAGNSPLPSDEVRSLAVEPTTGDVWMRFDATGLSTKGIARFDGTAWEVFPPSAIGLDPLADMWGPAIDAAGDVWVSSNAYQQPGSGVARWDGATWTVFNASTGQSDEIASRITTDDQGGVWVRWWKGLMRWTGAEWVDVPDPVGIGTWATLHVFAEDDIYVGTYGGQLAHWDGASWSLVPLEWGGASDWVLSVDREADGSLWVCTLNSGAWRRDPVTGAWSIFTYRNTGLPDYFLDDLAVGADGTMWIASGPGGLAQMNGTAADFGAATWRCFGAENEGFEPWPWGYSTPWGNPGAVGVTVDAAGGVWAASSGVGRWDGTSWDLYVPATSGIATQFGSDHVAEDAQGDLWVGFDLYGVDRFTGTEWTHFSTSNGLPGNFVDDLGVDPAGGLYVATNGGLGRWDGTGWTTIETPPSLPFSVRSVEVAPNGDLWIGTDGGAARRSGGEWTVHTQASGALAGDPVQDIVVADDGTVFVASFDNVFFPYQGGISRFDGTTWTTWKTSNSPLPHNQVTDLAFDLDGNLWAVCASEALAVLSFGDDPWTDLGGGTVGSAGAPTLVGGGPLTGGSGASLSLTDAPPGALLLAWLSFSSTPAPFFGGTIHATPFANQFLFSADATGSFGVSTTWPAGLPAGTQAWFQFLVEDPGVIWGITLSNGLLATTP